MEQKKTDGLCIAAIVLGIVSFFCCNPLYLVSLAAIIIGIIALAKGCNPKWMAILGMSIGAASVVVCLIIDIVTIPFTMGLSFLV